jgi:hypothetical protein
VLDEAEHDVDLVIGFDAMLLRLLATFALLCASCARGQDTAEQRSHSRNVAYAADHQRRAGGSGLRTETAYVSARPRSQTARTHKRIDNPALVSSDVLLRDIERTDRELGIRPPKKRAPPRPER